MGKEKRSVSNRNKGVHSTMVSTTISQTAKKQLEREAKKQYMTMTAYLRILIMKTIDKEKNDGQSK